MSEYWNSKGGEGKLLHDESNHHKEKWDKKDLKDSINDSKIAVLETLAWKDKHLFLKYSEYFKNYSKEEIRQMNVEQVYSTLIINESAIFFKIPKKIRRWNGTIWRSLIKSLLLEETGIGNIRDLINEEYPELRWELLQYLDECLSVNKKISNKDLNLVVKKLQDSNNEFVSVLKKLSIFKDENRKFVVNEKFIQEFTKSLLERPDYKKAWYIEKKEIKFALLMKTFWADWVKLGEEEMFLIDKIMNIIYTEETKIILEENKLKEKQKKQELEDWKKDQKEWDKEDDDKEDKYDNGQSDFEEMAQNVYPSMNFVQSSSSYWSYEVFTDYGPLEITREQAENFTSVSLKRYINFFMTINDFWLGFIWEKKYRAWFKTVLKNIFNMEVDAWLWVSEEGLLKIIDLIGFAIEIPKVERNWLDEDWKKVTEYRRFRDLWEAASIFRKINITKKINWKTYDASMWAPVEMCLIERWFLWEQWWVDIYKWKEYSK